MKVPEQITIRESALIIVSGAQVAKLYYVHQATRQIDELGEMSNTKDQYEFHNENARAGTTYGKDPTHVDELTIVQRDFNKNLKELIDGADKSHSLEAIYILCPGDVEKEIISIIPSHLKDKVVKIIQGNYVKTHPVEIVEKIF